MQRKAGFKQPAGGTSSRKQKQPRRLGVGPNVSEAVAAVRRKHRRRPGVMALKEVRPGLGFCVTCMLPITPTQCYHGCYQSAAASLLLA